MNFKQLLTYFDKTNLVLVHCYKFINNSFSCFTWVYNNKFKMGENIFHNYSGYEIMETDHETDNLLNL